MSQHDLEIANQTFPATRTDLNNALQALGSLQSGGTAPSTTYANQLWYDTANDILKLRNEDDDAWINVFEADQAADVINLISRLKAPDGTAGLPSISFASDTDTGIYRIGANQIGIATGGILRLIVDSDGDATFLSGTPSVKIKDIDSTGSSQVGQIDFVDSGDSTNASIGYLSGSNTRLSIKNDAASGDVRTNINGTDRLIVDSAGAEVVGTLDVSGNYSTTDGDITTTNGTVTANALVGDGSGITGLPTFTVEGRADAFGNDTTVTLSAGTILVLGEVFISTAASIGARVSVQLKDSGGSIIDSFDLLGMNEGNGTDGGSGMSGRINFTVAVPATVTQIRFYRTSGSRNVDGTVNQFLKYGV
jgi:hypothetical protein